MKVLDAQQMRKVDEYAIGKLKIPGLVLMENAGSGVASVVLDLISRIKKRVCIVTVCGKGNNGGDGLVASRHLLCQDLDVITFLLGKASDLKGDARTNFISLKKMGAVIHEISSAAKIKSELKRINKRKIIVDAMFGTGLSKPVRGIYREVIDLINETKGEVVSIDIPSGLDADRGVKLGSAIKASATVTFGYPKLGLLMGDSFDFVGDMFVKDITLPRPENIPLKLDIDLIEPSYVKSLFKPRRPDSHKGTNGHVLIVAGSREKSGAAKLCSVSCLRSGAGLVTLAVPSSAHDLVKSSLFNVMSLPIEDDGKGRIKAKAIDAITKEADGMDAVVIGPGLIKSRTVGDLIMELIKNGDKPMIVDADGLNSIAPRCRQIKGARPSVVFTPHPGEMARLTGLSTKKIQSDRINTARRFVEKHGITLVLKGFRSIISFAKDGIYINPTGNPAMGTAGMGDVLCGIMSAYIVQQRDFKKAVISSVFNHGLLGDLVSAQRGERGILATDLINKLTDISKTLYPSRTLNKIEELS